jgi:uncharacterized protein with GYD domain
MQTYIVMMNVSGRAAKSIKKAPAGIDANSQALLAAGGRLVNLYATMGQYDYIAVMEAPSDEVMLKHILEISASGALKCTTLKAFPKDEFVKIVASLA